MMYRRVARRYAAQTISTQEAERLFTYFHLSRRRVSEDTFVFEPRMTGDPMTHGGFFMPIEDNFTPRISLATSIEKAQEATPKSRRHLYATDEDLNVVDVDEIYRTKCKNELGNNYGPTYQFTEFVQSHADELARAKAPETRFDEETLRKIYRRDEETIREVYDLPIFVTDFYGLDKSEMFPGLAGGPKDLPRDQRKKWKYCVPDAGETGEVWATSPVELMYLGELSGNDITLSEFAHQKDIP